jgi:alcohol dehydrogenase, propanol-preferring
LRSNCIIIVDINSEKQSQAARDGTPAKDSPCGGCRGKLALPVYFYGNFLIIPYLLVQRKHDDANFAFKLEDHPIPSIGPSDVLVRISASGVCGTDLALAAGKFGPTCAILGHEGIGRVVQLGSGIPPGSVAIGQRVGVAWIRDMCGSCAMCLTEGGETRCLKQFHSGRSVDGTFAEYTVVPLRYLMKLPEGLSDQEIAPIMCGGVTIYKAIKICGATPGQWVAITGAGGGVGALGIQYAKSMGYRVVAIDGGEQKRNYCLGLGAEAYVDFLTAESVSKAVLRATEERGVRAVLAVAGSKQAYQESFEMMAPFGVLVCIGIPPPTELIQFHPLQFIDMGFQVIGSAVGTRADILDALEFVRRGEVVPKVQSAKLDELDHIMNGLTSGKVSIISMH